MSDSNEAEFLKAESERRRQQQHDSSCLVPPEGFYFPCDGMHPLGNPGMAPRPKPALGCDVAAGDGRRLFSKHEKALVQEQLDIYKDRSTPDFAAVAAKLRTRHPAYFGLGTPRLPEGIMRQQVRAIHLQGRPVDDGMENKPGSGRPAALPETVVAAIIAMLAAVAKTKAINFSARMLQPIAVGVIIAKGFGASLAAERKKGRFCASIMYICELMRAHKWKTVKPAGNARKLPPDWERLCRECMLRLAYFVLVFAIPMELVVNADHTGIMFLQYKGKGWLPEELWKSGEKAMQHLGDMRQFTLLASTTAAGGGLPHQVVFEGKTAGSLPAVQGVRYQQASSKGTFAGEMYHEKNSKYPDTQVVTRCFVALGMLAFSSAIGSLCVTHNHWSNHVTSMAYVKDIFVPYCKATIARLRAANPAACLPFGEQVCILVVDVWWGWLDRRFRQWLHQQYPWIRLVFVPAACTPVGQPMDAGVIAMLKAQLRDMYAKWVIGLVRAFIGAGRDPSTFQLPLDKQTASQNLVLWLCEALQLLKAERVVHCWDKTGLLGAWVKANGREAVERAAELFPNLAAAQRGLDDAPAPDPQLDTATGAPVDRPADAPVLLPSGAIYRRSDDESEGAQLQIAEAWLNWDAVATAPAAIAAAHAAVAAATAGSSEPSLPPKKRRIGEGRPDKEGPGAEEWQPGMDY